ncbi:MAG: Gldg family protein [Gammaproteobacteria bacterium]|nr:Gldg family protein [Gammaproteobacteria bacterium]
MKNWLNNRKFTSGSGLVIIGILLVAVVALGNVLLRGARIDLTENSVFTLSSGTKAILGKLDEPIDVYFFFSKTAAQGIPQLASYGGHIRETLEEMAGYSGGKLRLHVIDPEPFSDNEDRAAKMGVQPVPISNGGDNIYFGMAATNAVGKTEAIAFFQPERESTLEYDVTKAIYELNRVKKPVLGVLSSLEMQGGFDAQRMAPKPGWVIYDQLRQQFDVRVLEKEAKDIAKDVDLLMLVHPAALSAATSYAVDQFVMNGGKVLAFVDPFAESAAAGPNGMPTQGAQTQSNPVELLKSWGLTMRADSVLGDAGNALQVGVGMGPPVYHYAMLGISPENMHKDDVATRNLKRLNVAFVGILEPIKDSGMEITPLLTSSKQAAPLPTFRVQMGGNPAQLQQGFTPTNEQYTFAARAHGIAKSAYTSGPPAGVTATGGHLAQAKNPINVVVVADTDMLTDRFWVRVQDFFGQRLLAPWASNGDFVINLADNLAGSSDLIGIRGRAAFSRPFEKLEQMKRNADKNFRVKEQELQSRLRETESKLTAMERSKGEGNANLLSAEQQREIQNFRDEKLKIRKQLRDVRHKLDSDIDRLGSILKFINIVLMPLLLVIGVMVWVRMQRRKQGVAGGVA